MKPKESRLQLTGAKLLLAIVVGIALGAVVFFGVRAFKQWQANIPRVQTGEDFIEGTPGNDVLSGPDRPITIDGEAGDDRITGGN